MIKYESGRKYKYEPMDAATFFTVLNVAVIVCGGVGAYVGIPVCILGLIYDLWRGCHWNNVIMRLSLLVMNIYFLVGVQMKIIKKWKQVFIENPDGAIIAIETQQYPYEVSNHSILSLRDKEGWWWLNTFAKTNGIEIMRVHMMYETQETWYDRIKRKMVHRLR